MEIGCLDFLQRIEQCRESFQNLMSISKNALLTELGNCLSVTLGMYFFRA